MWSAMSTIPHIGYVCDGRQACCNRIHSDISGSDEILALKDYDTPVFDRSEEQKSFNNNDNHPSLSR